MNNSRNIVDRAIETVAPVWATKRFAARAVLESARSSSYRGSMATRTSQPWTTSTSYKGGLASERWDLFTMRDRARRVYRDNAIARSLLNTETDYVVAEGFTLRMRSDSPEFNAEAEKRFYRWLDNQADIQGMAGASDLFRMSWLQPRKDGDGGFILISRGGYPKLQYIPGDLIKNPYTGIDYRVFRDGVEVDSVGKPIRFHITEVDSYGVQTFTPIPARDFVFLSHRDDPLASRGATVYAPIFELLDQIDTYRDSVTKASILACMFGLIHRVNRPGNYIAQLGTATNSQGDDQKIITMEGGSVRIEGTAEDTYQVQASQPMQQTPEFLRALSRIAALGFEMPLEIAMRDVSQVNFSGGRIGLLGFYRTCRIKQDWLRSHCWNRIVFWWLSMERKRRELGFEDAFASEFPENYGEFDLRGREFEANDPMVEAQARLLDVSIGRKSLQQIVDEDGGDYEETLRQIETHRERMQTARIPIVLSTLTRDETPPAQTDMSPLKDTQDQPNNMENMNAK